MQVSALTQDGSAGVNTTSQGSSSLAIKGMSQDDFLKLLLTQLQAQDPLKPLDNQEFAAQLATFNSLDQLMGINKKLEVVQGQQQQLSQLEATALIGKEVRALGDGVTISEGKGATLHYAINANAGRVVVNIKDKAGNLVRTIEVGSQKAGDQSVTWDGKNTAGNPVEAGTYTFEVKAFDQSGNTVRTNTFVQGVVTGVDLVGNEPLLEVGGIKIPVSAVISVHTATGGNTTQTS
jgi:flagellar basal-body rod modification protein FlgD